MKHYIACALVVALSFPASAFACDLCAIHIALDSELPRTNKFRLALAEQFTEYDQLQLDGRKISNPFGQEFKSSITNVVLGYGFSETTEVALSTPFISRDFQRMEDGSLRSGSEDGIGDLVLTFRRIAYQKVTPSSHVIVQFFGGIEFPTGDSDRLAEETQEGHHGGEAVSDDHHDEHAEAVEHHRAIHFLHGDVEHSAGEGSAVHGHDLALGSGSFDFPFGIGVFVQHQRFFLSGKAQYTLRTEGDFDYRYANDFLWTLAPGYFFFLRDDLTVSARVNVAGEHKLNDEIDGRELDDTAIDSIVVGPEIALVANGRFSGSVGVDFPVDIDNTGLQAVMDYRIRGSLGIRF